MQEERYRVIIEPVNGFYDVKVQFLLNYGHESFWIEADHNVRTSTYVGARLQAWWLDRKIRRGAFGPEGVEIVHRGFGLTGF
jgi:hypothetical protein